MTTTEIVPVSQKNILCIAVLNEPNGQTWMMERKSWSGYFGHHLGDNQAKFRQQNNQEKPTTKNESNGVLERY